MIEKVVPPTLPQKKTAIILASIFTTQEFAVDEIGAGTFEKLPERQRANPAQTTSTTIAVNNERSIGMEVAKPVDLGYVKRWGDDNIAIRDAALFSVSPDKSICFKQDIAAGLSVYLNGVAVLAERPIVYGGLGGKHNLLLRI